jgi:hypothetical protein
VNWEDTVGLTIHAELVNHALKVKPDADHQKLERSIKNTSTSVGLTRQAICKVLQAEVDTLVAYRALGTNIDIDFIAGILSALDLVQNGKHVMDGTDDNDSYNNWQ